MVTAAPIVLKALKSTTSSTEETRTEPPQQPQDNDSSSAQLGAWVPVASVSSLVNLGPQRITIMNRDFVIWHQEETSKKDPKTKTKSPTIPPEELVWTVQTDACSHRFAPLSQGRVDPETQCIECPYHGKKKKVQSIWVYRMLFVPLHVKALFLTNDVCFFVHHFFVKNRMAI